jgi:outer membrane biosynthesis protein TonB
MWGRLGPRFALEAGFLILVAVALGIADLRPLVIVLVMAGAWLLVSLIELVASRQPPYSAAVERRVVTPAEPAAGPEAAPPAPAPVEPAPVAVEQEPEPPAPEPQPEPEPAHAPEPEAQPVPAPEPQPEPQPVLEPEPQPDDAETPPEPTAQRGWFRWRSRREPEPAAAESDIPPDG